MIVPGECQNACGGRCCEGFYINKTPLEIQDRYRQSVARIVASEDVPYDWEIVLVAEMILRVDEDDECEARYSCKNLRNGLCSIYDRRPAMCRTFPDPERGCFHCGYLPPVPIERRITAISSCAI